MRDSFLCYACRVLEKSGFDKHGLFMKATSFSV